MGPGKNPDGTITILSRNEAEDGSIGDGLVTIGPDDPRYEIWDRYLSANEHPVSGQGVDDPGDQRHDDQDEQGGN